MTVAPDAHDQQVDAAGLVDRPLVLRRPALEHLRGRN
jgi:hypothetical protein